MGWLAVATAFLITLACTIFPVRRGVLSFWDEEVLLGLVGRSCLPSLLWEGPCPPCPSPAPQWGMGWPVQSSVVGWGLRSPGAGPPSAGEGGAVAILLGSFSSSPRFPNPCIFLYYVSLFSFVNSQGLFGENSQKWIYAIPLGPGIRFSRYRADPKSFCFVWWLVHPLQCCIWTKYRLISFRVPASVGLYWAIHLWDKVQKRRGVDKKCRGLNEMQLNYLSCTKVHQIQHWFIWPEGFFVCGREGREIFGSGMPKGHRMMMGKFETSLTQPPGKTQSTWLRSHLCVKSDRHCEV